MKKTKEFEASGIPVRCSHTNIVDVDSLIPNPRNPNTHTDKQIALLAKIIKAQGWRYPIVVSNRSDMIVSGHGRLEAAKLLQVEKVPIDIQEFESEAKEYAMLIADNRLAELGERDKKKEKDLISDLDSELGLEDIELTGYTAEEVECMMTLTPMPEDETRKPKEVECPECGKVFTPSKKV